MIKRIFLILSFLCLSCPAFSQPSIVFFDTNASTECNGTNVYLDGEGSCDTIISGSNPAYDDIGAPDGISGISFSTFQNSWTSTTTASDFFTISSTGNFGDVSAVKIEQATGNATDGTLLELVTGDTDVDVLLAGDGTNTTTIQDNGSIVLAGSARLAYPTAASANILIDDGTNFESVAMTGDCSIDASGATSCAASASSIAYNEITAPSDISGITFGTFTNIWTFTGAQAGFTIVAPTAQDAIHVDVGDVLFDEDLDVLGIMEGATITEGGNAVFNSSETPGGELGGTWASPTIDDSILVTGWSITNGAANTPPVDDNDTSIANTDFVQQEINGAGGISLACDNGVCDVGLDYHLIQDPIDESGINFGTFTNVWTSTATTGTWNTWTNTMDSGVAFSVNNSDTNPSGETVLIQAIQQADGDAEAIFFQAKDNNGEDTVFQVGPDGATEIGTNASTFSQLGLFRVATGDCCTNAGTGDCPNGTWFQSTAGFPCYCDGSGDDLKFSDDTACTY